VAGTAQLEGVKPTAPIKKERTLKTQEAITGWLFASPWIIGFLLFTVGPMVFSAYVSFTQYNIIKTPEWIGLRNYEAIFRDRFFWKSLENTFWLVAVKVPFVMLSALGIAMLLNMKVAGERAFRTIIYLPNVLSGVAAIFLWQWILAPDGLLNNALKGVGIKGPAWFADPNWTKPGRPGRDGHVVDRRQRPHLPRQPERHSPVAL
jgi:multiple sugar transport system permease protein